MQIKNPITIECENIRYQIVMRASFFENYNNVDFEKNLNEHYAHILKIEAVFNETKCILYRNVRDAILTVQTKQTVSYCDTEYDLDFNGFRDFVTGLLSNAELLFKGYLSDPEKILKEAFSKYGIPRKEDYNVVIDGKTYNLKSPEQYFSDKMSDDAKLKLCKKLSENYNQNARPGIIEAIETNAIKNIILNKPVKYKYIIFPQGDLISVYYEEELLTTIPLAQIAFFGINIVNVLNNSRDDIEFYYLGKQIQKECGIAHLYFPEKFTGSEPLSAKHYAAFGDMEGLLEFIDKQLNARPSFEQKQTYLFSVNRDLKSENIDLEDEIMAMCEEIKKVSERQVSQHKTLDEMLVQKSKEPDYELTYENNSGWY